MEGPTDRLSNPVFTQKPDQDDFRMNIDMQDAIEAIRTDRHVITTVRELRSDLKGVTVFCVADYYCSKYPYQLAKDQVGT